MWKSMHVKNDKSIKHPIPYMYIRNHKVCSLDSILITKKRDKALQQSTSYKSFSTSYSSAHTKTNNHLGFKGFDGFHNEFFYMQRLHSINK
jgi:hypothetical protein